MVVLCSCCCCGGGVEESKYRPWSQCTTTKQIQYDANANANKHFNFAKIK